MSTAWIPIIEDRIPLHFCQCRLRYIASLVKTQPRLPLVESAPERLVEVVLYEISLTKTQDQPAHPYFVIEDVGPSAQMFETTGTLARVASDVANIVFRACAPSSAFPPLTDAQAHSALTIKPKPGVGSYGMHMHAAWNWGTLRTVAAEELAAVHSLTDDYPELADHLVKRREQLDAVDPSELELDTPLQRLMAYYRSTTWLRHKLRPVIPKIQSFLEENPHGTIDDFCLAVPEHAESIERTQLVKFFRVCCSSRASRITQILRWPWKDCADRN